MKKWIVFIKVWDLPLVQVREIHLESKTKEAAEKKASHIMGNRSFDILGVKEK